MSASDVTLLVQLSDSHLRMDEPQRAVQLGAAIDRVLALDPAPVAVLVTGDIADHGQREAYEVAADLLSALPMPVHVLPGNHDDRATLRSVFGVAGDGDDQVRYVAEAGPLRLVVCDTLIPGHVEGQLDVDWVAEQLDAEPDHPTVLALHHPPAKMGTHAMDGYGLPPETVAALTALLERSPQVLRVVAGHVHRAASTTIGGRALVTAPSVNFQLELDFVSSEALEINDDPPGFLIHALVDGQIVSHVQPVPRV